MRKITVLIDGSSHKLLLDDSINTNYYRYLVVKKATIYWNYFNVPNDANLTEEGSNIVTIIAGYYTFSEIAEKMPSNFKLIRLKNSGKCQINNTLITNSVVVDSNIQRMLGFSNTLTSFSPGYTQSETQVDMNNGLSYVRINCDIVNNLFNVDNKGKKSNTITSLPITTEQSLLGSVTSYNDIESKVVLINKQVSKIEFDVTDQDGKPINVGKILLELYLV